MKHQKTRAFLKRGLQLSVLLACGFYLLHDLDLSALVAAFLHVSPYVFVVLLILVALDYCIMGLRLKLLAPSLPYPKAAGIEILANSANIILPAKAGDLLKIGLIAKEARISPATATKLALWIRFSELHILAVIVASVAPRGIWALFFLVAIGWAGLVLLWKKPKGFFAIAERLPFAKLRGFCKELLYTMSERPAFLPRLFCCSCLVWLLYSVQYYWAAENILSVSLDARRIVLLFAVAAGISAIPGLPAGIGTYEAGIVLLLGSFGIPKEEAVLFSLCMRCSLYVPPVIAGGWLAYRNPVWKDWISFAVRKMHKDKTNNERL